MVLMALKVFREKEKSNVKLDKNWQSFN